MSMNPEKLLKKGKVKSIGQIERLRMKIAGRRDGRFGLPRLSEDGKWDSPFIHSLNAELEEFNWTIWGKVQMELEEPLVELAKLMDRESRLREKLKLTQMPRPYPEKESMVRRAGEESLSEDQVRRRRAREHRNKVAPEERAIAAMKEELDKVILEMIAIHNYVVERVNLYHIICQRVREHAEARLNAYWDAALKVHTSDAMPAYPEPILESEAEKNFMAEHRQLVLEIVAKADEPKSYGETKAIIQSAIGKEEEVA